MLLLPGKRQQAGTFQKRNRCFGNRGALNSKVISFVVQTVNHHDSHQKHFYVLTVCMSSYDHIPKAAAPLFCKHFLLLTCTAHMIVLDLITLAYFVQGDHREPPHRNILQPPVV
jgi:hypothetical protein